MEQKRLETKIGLFVFVGLVLLAVLLIQFSKGSSLFHGTYELRLHAANVGGLKPRASVLLAGVQVGSVSDILLAPDGKSVTIILKIYKADKIYHDARFAIEQAGFLGDQYVSVLCVSNELPVLTNGEGVDCEAPFNLQEVARSAAGFVSRIDDTAQKLDASVTDLRRVVLNVNTLTNFSITMNNMRTVSEQAMGTMGDINAIIATNASQVGLAVSNVLFFSQELTRMADSAGSLLATNEPEITASVENIKSSTDALKKIMDDLQSGRGLAGTVLQNQQLATNVQAIANNLSVATSNLNRLGLWHFLWHKEPLRTNAPPVQPSIAMNPLWAIRLLFLGLCILAGYAISQVRPEFVEMAHAGWIGMVIGFGFGGLLIAVDEMLKGFSLRAFSATTFGLLLGTLVALLVDHSGLFEEADDRSRWLIRLGLFLCFGYIGIILAMRSNKEDFSLIIPYVRFSPQNKPDNLLLLDTSVIIDGRIADLIETRLLEGLIIVPRFVLREIQQIADSGDAIKRARGRRGLEMLNRIQRNGEIEVRIHDGDFPDEKEVDSKLVRLARNLNAKLFTNDYNLGKIAALQKVNCINLHEVSKCLKVILLPGELLQLKIVREGKDKGQGIGYLPDGTMVVVNNGQPHIGQHIEAEVQTLLQTGAGIIVFADMRGPSAKTETAFITR